MFVDFSWNSKWNLNQYLFDFDEKVENRGDNSMKYHCNLNQPISNLNFKKY
jgi:hypothetical protein